MPDTTRHRHAELMRDWAEDERRGMIAHTHARRELERALREELRDQRAGLEMLAWWIVIAVCMVGIAVVLGLIQLEVLS